jgi:Ca-activated chloride channel homolog
VKILDSSGTKYTRPTSCLLALLAALCLVCALPALAQSDAAATNTASLNTYDSASTAEDAQGSLITIRKRVDEVNVLFIATDKHGKFVRDLNQTDFAILDDHKPPQSILNFRRETDLPLHLGLLIDVSGSVHSRFDFEQDAATSFLQHSIRAGFDKAFVVGFNTQSNMSQDFTDNVQLLASGVHKLQDGGGTALYDAI